MYIFVLKNNINKTFSIENALKELEIGELQSKITTEDTVSYHFYVENKKDSETIFEKLKQFDIDSIRLYEKKNSSFVEKKIPKTKKIKLNFFK